MPIYKDNNNIGDVYFGGNTIGEAYFGNNLVYQNLKYVDLGTGTSFNVANFSRNYRNLNVNNFFIVGNSSCSLSGREDTDNFYIYEGFVKSYNASTGQLTFYTFLSSDDGQRIEGSLHVILVEKTNKLKRLGVGFSFNVSSYADYNNFDYRNFLILRPWNTAFRPSNPEPMYSGQHYQIAGVRQPLSWSASANINVGYSGGVFSCNFTGTYTHSNSGSANPRVRTDQLEVYLFPKVL